MQTKAARSAAERRTCTAVKKEGTVSIRRKISGDKTCVIYEQLNVDPAPFFGPRLQTCKKMRSSAHAFAK